MALNGNYVDIVHPVDIHYPDPPPEDRLPAHLGDPVQQRMLILLLLVTLMIPAMFLALDKLGSGNQRWATVAANPDVGQGAAAVIVTAVQTEGQGGALPVAASDDALSPVFAAEVRYWKDDILRWAAEYDLDPNLVAIIMQVESCGDPGAASGAGAQGLFQVMPFHFTAGENMTDPDTNARRGLNYFVEGLRYHDGDIGLTYAGYNGGHGTSAKNWSLWPNETQRYYTWTTGIYEDIQAGLTTSPTLEAWLQAGGSGLCRQAASRLGITG